MTKNMFIWYDSRGFWMIGNNQHFAKQNGEGNLRLYTRGTLKNTGFRVFIEHKMNKNLKVITIMSFRADSKRKFKARISHNP